MHNYHFKRIFPGILVVFFISFMIVNQMTAQSPQSLSSVSSPTTKETTSISNPSSATDDYQLLNFPFLYNNTGMTDWLKYHIYDNATLQRRGNFFSETDQSGESITDDKHNFEAFSVYLDGLVYLDVASQDLIPAYFQYDKLTEFFDSNSSSRGFYTWVGSDWNSNSTIKEFNSNAQALLTFANYLISDLSYYNTFNDAGAIVGEQTDIINNLFWDAKNSAYNHSTIDDSKYIVDQFIGAIIGFQTHRASKGGLSAEYKSSANQTATYIMQKMMNVSNPTTVFEFNTAKRCFNTGFTGLGTNGDYKELATNAYAIWALVEWFLESGATALAKTEILSKAELCYQAMNALWNSTYQMYMQSASNNLGSIYDSSMSLQDNAIMMVALQRLFQVTGNFTYFMRISEMLNSTLMNFRDPIYGNYYKEIQSDKVFNTAKSFSTHAYLFRAFKRITALSDYLAPTISTNSSIVIKDENSFVNMTASLNFTFNELNPAASYVQKVAVPNASYVVTVRYPNSTIITTENLVSNNSGVVQYMLPLTESYPLGAYNISVRINYTNLATQFTSVVFNIKPGMFVHNASYAINSRVGESNVLNMTLNSTRLNATYFNISISGANINSVNLENQLIVNKSLTSFECNVVQKSIASIGRTYFTVNFTRNGISYFEFNVSYYVITPLLVSGINNKNVAFPGNSLDISINFENYINMAQDVQVRIEGEYLNGTYQTVQLTGLDKITLNLKANISRVSPCQTTFNLTIIRVSDGERYFSSLIDLEIKSVIEFLMIEGPSNIYHGDQAYILCKIQNNLDTSVQIRYSLNNQANTTITLQAGVNNIQIPVGGMNLNPYQLGEMDYDIKLYDHENNLIYDQVVRTSISVSVGSVILGYILPILIPLIGMVIFRHYDIENKKRLA